MLSACTAGPLVAVASEVTISPALSQAVYSTITEEITHPVRVFQYTPRFEVLAKNQLDGAAPEAAVARYLLAMQAGEYHAAYGAWDLSSQKILREHETALSMSQEARLAKWASTFAPNRLFSTHRIEYGRYENSASGL